MKLEGTIPTSDAITALEGQEDVGASVAAGIILLIQATGKLKSINSLRSVLCGPTTVDLTAWGLNLRVTVDVLEP